MYSILKKSDDNKNNSRENLPKSDERCRIQKNEVFCKNLDSLKP